MILIITTLIITIVIIRIVIYISADIDFVFSLRCRLVLLEKKNVTGDPGFLLTPNTYPLVN